MRGLTVKEKIARSIARHEGIVSFRSDFKSMGSPSQISRALRELINEGVIVRISHGIYAKARPSSLSGKPVAQAVLAELTEEVLEKMGIPVRLGQAQEAYASGRTPDVPMYTAFDTGERRITRKITIGRSTVRFENKYNTKRKKTYKDWGAG